MTPKPLSITPPAAYVPLLVQGVRLIVMPVVPQPPAWINDLHGGEFSKRAPYDLEDDEGRYAGFGFQTDDRMWHCPFGKSGDVFAVREALIAKECAYGTKVAYESDGLFSQGRRIEIDTPHGKHVEACTWTFKRDRVPARAMPLDFARLHYRTLSVAVRPVQTITEEEAEAAGFKASHVGDGSSATDQFAAFFDTLYPQALTANNYCYFAAVEVAP